MSETTGANEKRDGEHSEKQNGHAAPFDETVDSKIETDDVAAAANGADKNAVDETDEAQASDADDKAAGEATTDDAPKTETDKTEPPKVEAATDPAPETPKAPEPKPAIETPAPAAASAQQEGGSNFMLSVFALLASFLALLFGWFAMSGNGGVSEEQWAAAQDQLATAQGQVAAQEARIATLEGKVLAADAFERELTRITELSSASRTSANEARDLLIDANAETVVAQVEAQRVVGLLSEIEQQLGDASAIARAADDFAGAVQADPNMAQMIAERLEVLPQGAVLMFEAGAECPAGWTGVEVQGATPAFAYCARTGGGVTGASGEGNGAQNDEVLSGADKKVAAPGAMNEEAGAVAVGDTAAVDATATNDAEVVEAAAESVVDVEGVASDVEAEAAPETPAPPVAEAVDGGDAGEATDAPEAGEGH